MTIIDDYRADEGRVLDRLVDGELSQAERRALLAALDDEPGAWRRCALAFLESQSWRWQLAQIASEPLVAQAATRGPAGSAAISAKRSNGLGRWLAIAAGLLISFTLGTRFTPAPQQAANVPSEASSAVAAHDALPAPVPEAIAENPSEPAAEASAAEPNWETLTLASLEGADGESAASSFEVRVRDNADSQTLQELLSANESALPEALVRQLELEGWQVSRQRQLVPVSLPDGRRMVMPVEQIDVQRPDIVQF